MMQTLWLAGLLIANLWAAGELNGNSADDPAVRMERLLVDAENLRPKPDESRRGTGEPPAPESRTPIIPATKYEVDDHPIARVSNVMLPPMTASYTPVVPPIKTGEKPCCENPPTNEEILRALPTLARGIPYVYDQYRDDMEFTVEKLVDRVGEPRFFPLIGPAQLHHCHWKCTVTFTEVIEITNPFPFTSKTQRAEVVYIDEDRLHLCAEPKTDVAKVAAEMTQSCPGGHYRPMPKTTTNTETPRQVQMEIRVFSINRAAIPDETYQRVRKELGLNGKNNSGVTKNRAAATELLQSLRKAGFVQVITDPRVTTFSGRPARIVNGGDDDYLIANALPAVKDDGRISLEVAMEIMEISVTSATKAGLNNKSKRSVDAVALIGAGEALALGGLARKEVTLTRSGGIPLLDELPYIGEYIQRITQTVAVQETERELLILVTPHIVTQGDAAETAEPPLHDARTAPTPVPVSSKIYVIVDAGEDGQQVTALPAAEQTVLDAVKSVNAANVRKVPREPRFVG